MEKLVSGILKFQEEQFEQQKALFKTLSSLQWKC
jgi:carbonic anhydrase